MNDLKNWVIDQLTYWNNYDYTRVCYGASYPTVEANKKVLTDVLEKIREIEQKTTVQANVTTVSDCPAEVKVGILEELVKKCYSEAHSELAEDTVEQIEAMFGKEALEEMFK